MWYTSATWKVGGGGGGLCCKLWLANVCYFVTDWVLVADLSQRDMTGLSAALPVVQL